jgi:glycosyltransferase involved in cell wall biosynthesis
MSNQQRITSAFEAFSVSSREKSRAPAAQQKGFSLPLVSVIITNYNYGRYLRDAVESVRAQSYPNVECIIVDDASTDESPSILAALGAEFSDIKIVRKDRNAGQTAAFCDGFAASDGDYVIFLDADDILLPAAVETHAYVHLSSRVPVGMTTSDMMQAVNGRIVLSCDQYIAGYVRSGRGRRENLLRGIDLTAPDLWEFEHLLAKDIEERTHLLEYIGWDEWVYTPTSGNCFRRDALTLALDPSVLAGFRLNADAYLNRFVCLLHGGILIDIALSIYCIHTSNGFISQAYLFGKLHYKKEKEIVANIETWKAAVGVLIDDVARVFDKLEFHYYARAIESLARAFIYSKQNSDQLYELDADSATEYVLNRLILNETKLCAALGRDHYRILLRLIEDIQAGDMKRPKSWWRRRFAEFCLTFGRTFHWSWLIERGEQIWRG